MLSLPRAHHEPGGDDDPTGPALAAADEVAEFTALYRAHFDFVVRTLRRLGVPPALVDDAAQEVFVVVFRHRPAELASTRGWLFGIARRIAWRTRRSGARQRRLAEALGQARPQPADGAAAVAEREAAALLGRFLDHLGDDKREVFLLAELEEMTAPEISRILGVKENTVYSRLRAARQDFDRAFARLRLRERRALGEAANDDQALLLSRARRAHTPTPEMRRRVLVGVLAALGLPIGEAAAATTPAIAAATPKLAAPLATSVGTSIGSHVAWGIAVALVGVVAVAAGRDGTASTSAAITAPAAANKPDPWDMSSKPTRSRLPDLVDEVAAGVDPADADAGADADAARAASAPEAPDASRDRAPVRARKHVSSDRLEESPAPGDAPTPAPVDVDADALQREAELLARARAELQARRFDAALALLDRHARDFPGGVLASERQLSRIAALCGRGERSAARAAAERVAAERPGSAAARRAIALSLCPDGEDSSTDVAAAGD